MRLPFTQFAQSAPLFTVDEARQLYKKDERNRSLLNLLHRLKKQNRVRQLANGVYAGTFATTPLNRYRVPSALRDDAVVALHSRSNSTGSPTRLFKPSTISPLAPARMWSLTASLITVSFHLALCSRQPTAFFKPNEAPTMSCLPDASDPSSTACSFSTTVEASKNSTSLSPCFLRLISKRLLPISNCSAVHGSIRAWASFSIAMRTNSIFVERSVTVFSTTFRAVWFTSPTNVPANAGSLHGNSWCLRRSHLRGRTPCKHEIHTRTNPPTRHEHTLSR